MHPYFDEGRPLGRDGALLEFCSKMPARSGPQYFFRAVSEEEYNLLATEGSFYRAQSYQGISPTETYALHYFGATQSHYLVEFTVDEGIDLVGEFHYAGTGQKAESGVMSLGIGRSATPVTSGRAANGGDYFTYCLRAGSIRWRLVRYIGTKPPAVCRG